MFKIQNNNNIQADISYIDFNFYRCLNDWNRYIFIWHLINDCKIACITNEFIFIMSVTDSAPVHTIFLEFTSIFWMTTVKNKNMWTIINPTFIFCKNTHYIEEYYMKIGLS